MAMQFWGVEVKAKEPCNVILEEGNVIHISQATLGDLKKDNETVIVHVKIGDKKLVLGMLSQKSPQLSFDLVFEKDFEISHNWKNGSIHLMGYQTEMGGDDSMSEFGSSDDDLEDVLLAKENGQLFAQAANVPAGKPKEDNTPKIEEKDESDDSDSSDSEDVSDDADDSDEEMGLGDSDSEDDEDDSDESEEETPAKLVESGKKRPNADVKTPQSKKAKIATPSDGKKGVVHPGTPHPNKKGGKTPASDKTPKSAGAKTPKSGDKTPKSGGSDVSCGPCKKTFKSESALLSHSKAKHAK